MEKDLYQPIKDYFTSFGYTGDGEVEDIDLYLQKEDCTIAIELKVTLDFKAIQQAALRQKVADYVFIGTYVPKDYFSKSFRNKLYLLKRLGIGLICLSKRSQDLSIVNEPKISELSLFQKRNQQQKLQLSTELQKRKIKNNTGGVFHKPVMTSYKEDALCVLEALYQAGGCASTKTVRENSRIARSTSILYHNYSGWFLQIEKGTYALTESGKAARETFHDTIQTLLTLRKKEEKSNR